MEDRAGLCQASAALPGSEPGLTGLEPGRGLGEEGRVHLAIPGPMGQQGPFGCCQGQAGKAVNPAERVFSVCTCVEGAPAGWTASCPRGVIVEAGRGHEAPLDTRFLPATLTEACSLSIHFFNCTLPPPLPLSLLLPPSISNCPGSSIMEGVLIGVRGEVEFCLDRIWAEISRDWTVDEGGTVAIHVIFVLFGPNEHSVNPSKQPDVQEAWSYKNKHPGQRYYYGIHYKGSVIIIIL